MDSPKRVERQFFGLLVATIAPGLTAALVLLWGEEWLREKQVEVVLLAMCITGGFAVLLVSKLRFWVRTVTNLISSLREGDYSIRVRGVANADVWSGLVQEVNLLADQLRGLRVDEREASGLLQKVMAEIPVGIFIFDARRELQFVNPAGLQLLESTSTPPLGRSAQELNLGPCLEGPADQTIEFGFGSHLGRWGVRRVTVRQDGQPHALVVLTDLRRMLREEERLAWQRMVRVLGHEVNNSLAPIQSIAESLKRGLEKNPRAVDWEDDCSSGLSVIRGRSEALSRFIQSFARVARLPPPIKTDVAVPEWVSHTASLESRLTVGIVGQEVVVVQADLGQLEQLLINLIQNGVDAALRRTNEVRQRANEGAAKVEVSWRRRGNRVEIAVEDNGCGIEAPENLFVPFYTTKPGGSGIGLALCRQIAELHDGTLSLSNRPDQAGAVARLSLPLGDSA